MANGEASSSRGTKRQLIPGESSRKRQKVQAEKPGDDSGLGEELPDNLIQKSTSSRQGEDSNDSESIPISTGADSYIAPTSSRPAPEPPQPLSTYTCPICFCAPTNATLTPCGHVCCGSCLFTAIKTMMQRGALIPGSLEARCPVCRAEIPGWDGKGGGVVGLQTRFVMSV
ncbi:RING-type domain-containing protein [Mycena indigotica]|uniref:RING-type domain-containing protein n=1 Tax=Mycena indigotica TaxID=2126181 RepID=A0A8H6VR57_9AGAR|nr:RING-type domain-containing protein [Mycena indigotica]KAF7290699.1 RING-type domain-containing protein [Mycena indigotica]